MARLSMARLSRRRGAGDAYSVGQQIPRSAVALDRRSRDCRSRAARFAPRGASNRRLTPSILRGHRPPGQPREQGSPFNVMEEDAMNPVVHFEMPYADRERM